MLTVEEKEPWLKPRSPFLPTYSSCGGQRAVDKAKQRQTGEERSHTSATSTDPHQQAITQSHGLHTSQSEHHHHWRSYHHPQQEPHHWSARMLTAKSSVGASTQTPGETHHQTIIS